MLWQLYQEFLFSFCIHHMRKQYQPDPINTDGMAISNEYVLQKAFPSEVTNSLKGSKPAKIDQKPRIINGMVMVKGASCGV